MHTNVLLTSFVSTATLSHTHTQDTREAIVAFECSDVVQAAMGLSGMELGVAAVSIGPALRAPMASVDRGVKRAADDVDADDVSADKRARED